MTLSKAQEQARKSFWSLEEQEPENYDRFINDLIARTRNELLDEIEAGMPKVSMSFDAARAGHGVYEAEADKGYNDCLAEVLNHLKSLRD